jgi:hypothetical protein
MWDNANDADEGEKKHSQILSACGICSKVEVIHFARSGRGDVE